MCALVVFQKLDLSRNPYLEKRITNGVAEGDKVYEDRMKKYKLIVRDNLQ